MRAVLQYLHAQPELFAQHRATFLLTFCDKVPIHSLVCNTLCVSTKVAPERMTLVCKVLAARDRPANAAIDAYRPLLAALTHEEFSGTLLPLIARMAKRSPYSVLSSTARMLGMLELDLSRHAEVLLADVQPLLRHAKQPIR